MLASRPAGQFASDLAAAGTATYEQMAQWITAASANVSRLTLEGWLQRIRTYERNFDRLKAEALIGGTVPAAITNELRTITDDAGLNVASAANANSNAVAAARNEMVALLNLASKKPNYTATGDTTGVVYTPAELSNLVSLLTAARATFLTYG